MQANTSKDKFEMVAKTYFGLEKVLAKELINLGAADVEVLNRAVRFKGDQSMLYRSNYCLRTALRILKPVLKARILNEKELYDAVRDIKWSKLLKKDGTLAIDPMVKSKYFNNSLYIAQKAKDAIVDQFRDTYGIRPSVNKDNPDLLINVHLTERDLIVSLDSSGESLHKRGYRVENGDAPLSEVLAAGMIMLSGWHGNKPFYDLMCGSGTLPIEAALIANKVPGGYYRKNFGFERWLDFRADMFNRIKQEYKPQFNPIYVIHGMDISHEAIISSRRNAQQAHLSEFIRFSVCDIFKTIKSSEEGIIIINPPYGERMKQEDLNTFYKKIGDVLKNNYQGYDAWILSSNKEALKYIGLHADKNITLYNGQLECRYSHFKLYAGSQKTKYLKNKA